MSKIDSSFTPDIENHLRQGVYFVPCISLFKSYDDYDKSKIDIKTSKESWLVLVIKMICKCNIDLKEKLYKLVQTFLKSYKFKSNTICRLEFFCTVLIPLLDDMGIIDCFTSDYNFIAMTIHTIIVLTGNWILMKEKEYINFKTSTLDCSIKKLNSSCYDLISLKSSTYDNIDKSIYSLPMEDLIRSAPMLYKYEPFQNEDIDGILTQIFLYATGNDVTMPDNLQEKHIFIIKANHLLSRLPFEWKHLLHVHKTNCACSLEKNDEYICNVSHIYFYISPNDVYTALYYISRVLSYYVKLEQFESENYMFQLYDLILKLTLEEFITSGNIIDDKRKIAEKVIRTLAQHLEPLPLLYTIPTGECIEFNYFSNNTIKHNIVSIPFYKCKSETSEFKIQCCGKLSLHNKIK